jgi:alkyl sulfatase BDS1-like metallo-beta-lactamase superfamily hydrolase
MADLAGGENVLMQKAHDAMQSGDELVAAELAWHVTKLQPDNPESWQLLGEALAVIGERTFNAPARNYTLSSSNRYLKHAEELKSEQ